MHKKLEGELVSLAHSILKMKNKDDVNALHKKAQDITEKLALLKFVNDYINTTPAATETKEDLIEKISTVVEEDDIKEDVSAKESIVETEKEEIKSVEEIKEEVAQELGFDEVFVQDPVFERVVEKTVEETEIDEVVFEKVSEVEKVEEPKLEELNFEKVSDILEPINNEVEDVIFEEKIETEDKDPFVKKETFTHQEIEEIFNTKNLDSKDDVRDVAEIQFTIEDEFKEKVADVETKTVFEKAPKKEDPKEKTDVEDVKSTAPKSLNDMLFTKKLQVGLNDRIAFVKNLFDGSQEDFNRVLSQLNSFKSEKEAKDFINNFVKPEYDWSEKEEYEGRLINLIERKFL